MKKILVTGGTGVLGREIVKELQSKNADVVTLTHQRATRNRYGDLLSKNGLTAALEDREIIVHAATSTKPLEDLQMTQNLIEAAQEAGVRHLVYVSIAGIDGVDYDYYRAKLAGEKLVSQSGLPYTIRRATQFFEFMVRLLNILRIGPVQLAPTGVRVQPIDVREVGRVFADLALGNPQGRMISDLAGPEILALEQMARDWSTAPWILPLQFPHPGLQATRQIIPQQPRIVGRSWESWLTEKRAGIGT